MSNEVEQFISVWEQELAKTAAMLECLPRDQYDFRPDAEGRSLGELAWHLAEGDAFITYGISQGAFTPGLRPPGIERPRKIEELAPAFQRVHGEAVERIRALTPADLDRKIPFLTGDVLTIRELMWSFILMHTTHHRGQLSLMCRLAGGKPAAVFGPTREMMPPKKP